MGRLILLSILASSTCFARSHVASAGVLANHAQAFNDGNGPDGGAWSGASSYQDGESGTVLFGTVEWAVFEPDEFPFAGLNGWAPAPGQLVYAFQLIHSGAQVVQEFGGEFIPFPTSNAGVADLGVAENIAPSEVFIDAFGPGFRFLQPSIPASGGTSAGLVFSSDRIPTLTTFVVFPGGGVLEFGELPRPLAPGPSDTIYAPINVPGDFDNDGDADGADFLKWQAAFGSDDSMADGNDDGIVDAEDLQIWIDEFGETGGGAAVPEPAAVALFAVGALAAVRRRRMRSRT
jgi:hypothetical protein